MGWRHSSGLYAEDTWAGLPVQSLDGQQQFSMASRGRVQEHNCDCVTPLLRKLLMFLKTPLVEERDKTGKKKKKRLLTDQVVKLMGCYGSETRQGFLLETASDTELGGRGGAGGRQGHWGKLRLILQRSGRPKKSKGQKQPAQISWGLGKRNTNTGEHQCISQD